MKIKYLSVITRIVSKIDMSRFFQELKEIDFAEGSSLNNLSQEDIGKVGMLFLEILFEKLNDIESDVEEFISLYEDKSIEEIQELDIIEEFTKIFKDEGIRKSFSFALKKTTEQTS